MKVRLGRHGLWCVLVIGCGATMVSSAAERTVEIVGHRGSSYSAPENTRAAVQLAWDEQADAVEFDVYLSRDGQIVLLHDKDLKRTAGLEKRVDELTAAELQQLDVGLWKNEKYRGEPVPLLQDILTTVPAGKRVFIEVKCGPEIVAPLREVFAASTLSPEQTAIISFSREVCQACREAFPERKTYWIVSLKQDSATGEWNHTAAGLIAEARKLGVQGLDLQAVPLLDKAFGDAVLQAGLELYVWTVNDVALARRMIAAGVQGLTTDRPGWLREQLAQ